jgi:hypothetical protein
MGRPLYTLGCEPALVLGRPCDSPGCAASANPLLSFPPRWFLTHDSDLMEEEPGT